MTINLHWIYHACSCALPVQFTLQKHDYSGCSSAGIGILLCRGDSQQKPNDDMGGWTDQSAWINKDGLGNVPSHAHDAKTTRLSHMQVCSLPIQAHAAAVSQRAEPNHSLVAELICPHESERHHIQRAEIPDHLSPSGRSFLCIRTTGSNLTLDLWLRGSAILSTKSARSGEMLL